MRDELVEVEDEGVCREEAVEDDLTLGLLNVLPLVVEALPCLEVVCLRPSKHGELCALAILDAALKDVAVRDRGLLEGGENLTCEYLEAKGELVGVRYGDATICHRVGDGYVWHSVISFFLGKDKKNKPYDEGAKALCVIKRCCCSEVCGRLPV